MSYKCISPQLKFSCYNCKHYQVSGDMLNGLCFLHGDDRGKAAIGIGTCNEFTTKGPSSEFAWQQIVKSDGLASAAGN